MKLITKYFMLDAAMQENNDNTTIKIFIRVWIKEAVKYTDIEFTIPIITGQKLENSRKKSQKLLIGPTFDPSAFEKNGKFLSKQFWKLNLLCMSEDYDANLEKVVNFTKHNYSGF